MDKSFTQFFKGLGALKKNEHIKDRDNKSLAYYVLDATKNQRQNAKDVLGFRYLMLSSIVTRPFMLAVLLFL